MAAAMARSPPTSQSDRIRIGSPRSRAMNPVVVKMPPPIMLLTKTQEAVNQPILDCAAAWPRAAGSLMCRRREDLKVLLGKEVEIVDETIAGCFHFLSYGFFGSGMAEERAEPTAFFEIDNGNAPVRSKILRKRRQIRHAIGQMMIGVASEN